MSPKEVTEGMRVQITAEPKKFPEQRREIETLVGVVTTAICNPPEPGVIWIEAESVNESTLEPLRKATDYMFRTWADGSITSANGVERFTIDRA